MPAQPWSAVPADVGAELRRRLPALVEHVIAALREEVDEYGQPLEGEFGRMIREGVTAGLNQFVELLGHDGDMPDLEVYEALGRAEFRAGRTLDALQQAYRIGARVSWRDAADFGHERGLEPKVMYHLAEAIFAYIDRLAAASVAGYTREESLQAGSLQARRHALIELLARNPPADPAEVARAAEHAAWETPARVAALAVGDSDPVALARRLPAGCIGAAIEPVGIVLVPDPDGPGRAAQLQAGLRLRRGVLGPSVWLRDAHRSIARATAAWPLHAARRLGDASLARASDHLLELLLASDPRLTRDLLRARLAPLDAMAPGPRARAEQTLRAWLDAHGDVSAAAEALHVHPQTVRYRLGQLREAFGEALDNPGARLEIALALRAQAGRGASAGPPPPPGSE